MNIGAFALLDCLGWKGIWARDAVKADPEALMRFLVDGLALEKNNVAKQIVEEFHSEKLDVAIAFVSDSVAISVHARDGIELSEGEKGLAVHLACMAASLIMRRFLYARTSLLLRGNISFGAHSIQQNFFLGPAVDRAAEFSVTAQGAFVWLSPEADKLLHSFIQGELKNLDALLAGQDSLKQIAHAERQWTTTGKFFDEQSRAWMKARWHALSQEQREVFAKFMLEISRAFGYGSLVLPNYPVPMRSGGNLTASAVNPLAMLGFLGSQQVGELITKALCTFDSARLDILQKKQFTEAFLMNCFLKLGEIHERTKPFLERLKQEEERMKAAQR